MMRGHYGGDDSFSCLTGQEWIATCCVIRTRGCMPFSCLTGQEWIATVWSPRRALRVRVHLSYGIGVDCNKVNSHVTPFSAVLLSYETGVDCNWTTGDGTIRPLVLLSYGTGVDCNYTPANIKRANFVLLSDGAGVDCNSVSPGFTISIDGSPVLRDGSGLKTAPSTHRRLRQPVLPSFGTAAS